MRRVLLITTILTGIAFLTFSQNQDMQKVAKAKEKVDSVASDTANAWYIDGTGNLAFSQVAFSNWAAGGEGSIGANAFINLKANYKKGRNAWGNTIDIGYGFNYLGKMSNASFSKTNDKIEITSAYGYAFTENKKWLVTALVNFRTQFSAGYNYPDDSTVISNFMSPGYLIVGAGFTYIPVKWFYLYMSPASGRFTFVLDKKLSDSGAFGVDKGKTVLIEFGPYIRADFSKDLSPTINLATTLELFTAYNRHFGNIAVNWNLLLTMKVNKWLAASVATQLIYDDNVNIKTTPTSEPGPRTQFKEMVGIGLTYKFR